MSRSPVTVPAVFRKFTAGGAPAVVRPAAGHVVRLLQTLLPGALKNVTPDRLVDSGLPVFG